MNSASKNARPQFAVFLKGEPGLRRSLRPLARPVAKLAVSTQNAPVVSFAPGRVSMRPEPRPQGLKNSADVVQVASGRRQTAPIIRGGERKICGSKSIWGENLSPIRGRLKGCAIADPVKVTSIDGVWLTQPATMDCSTAKALDSWVKNGVKPAVQNFGGGVASLKVISHYSCRTRNSQPGAKLSEHGKGRAIDIAAINLKNGTSLTVLKGWRNKARGKLLRIMHATACGPFKTVLGPNADKYHQDHFHLDTSRRGGKAYCR